MADVQSVNPPSYDSVVNKVNSQLQTGVSLQDIYKVATSLSKEEADLLTSHPDASPLDLKLNEKAREKYNKAFVDALNSDYAKQHLEFTADAAAKACKAIDAAFDALATKLGTIDALASVAGAKPFTPDFLSIRKDYQETLSKSQSLAVRIATYAERFDENIVPFCFDTAPTKEEKIEKLDDFIAKAEEFRKDSDDMARLFNTVTSKLRLFATTFASWSLGKQSDLEAEVKQLDKDIEDLTKEIEEYQKQLLISGGVAAGSLPVFGIAAICLGPFAPVAIIAGCISAGVATGFAVSYASKITDRKARRTEKEKKRTELNKQIGSIKATRNDLIAVGEKTVAEVTTNVKVLADIWVYTKNDATAIREALKYAGEDIKYPAYMMTSVGKAAGVYSQMAIYLRRYADGVTKK